MIPPSTLSVYRFCQAFTDPDGRTMLTDIVPYRFQDLDDTIIHRVTGRQTLQDIAAYRYQAYGEEAYLLWIVLAHFQPDPVLDPTLPLEPGSILYVPSYRVIEEEILNETRRSDYEGGEAG